MAHEASTEVEAPVPVWAENIRRLTEQSGLSQAELARRAGLTRDAYSRYLLGRTRPPAAKLAALAKVLNVEPKAIDPDREDMDGEAVRSSGRLPFRITPARGGQPKRVYIEVSAEMDVEDAMRIVEIVTNATGQTA